MRTRSRRPLRSARRRRGAAPHRLGNLAAPASTLAETTRADHRAPVVPASSTRGLRSSRTITGLRSGDEDTATRAGTFRAALGHRGYRLVLSAYACGASSIGASSIVVSVSLFARTGSPAWAGVGALIRVVPFMLFSGVAGVVIDRTDGRRMLVLAVTAQVACSAVLVVAASRAPLVAVAALGFVSTLLWTPAYPSMASLVPRMVGAENLAPANALMSTVESVGWSVGPAVGGLLLTVTGPGLAATAAAVIAGAGTALALWASRQPLATLTVTRAREPFLQSFRDGVRAIFATSAVVVPLVLVLVTDMVFGATQVVLLIAATDLLGMSRGGFGALSAALGAGSLAALLIVNRAARSGRALVVLGVAVLGASLPLALVAAANGPPMALVLVGILGLGTVVTDVLALTALQRLIPSDRLARVFGILDSLLVGANVLGAAVSAWLVGLVGIRATLVAFGVAPMLAVVGITRLSRHAEPDAVDLAALRPAVDLLAALPMLRTASLPSIEAMAAAATERSMPLGTAAVAQGDAPDDFYVIVRGRFDVLVTSADGATRRMRSLGEGDGFGEIGLLHGVPRTATVVATTDARVLQVPGRAFLRAVGGGAVTGGTGPAAGAIDYFTAG